MSIPLQIKASVCLPRADRYEGQIDPAKLPRLSRELAGPSQPMQVEVNLKREIVGDWLRGRARGSLELQCQRCAQLFTWPLDVAMNLRLVRSDAEAEQVLEESDPYMVEDDTLPLVDIVEEEMLLALPMMPRCAACESALAAPQTQAEEAGSKKPSPFANLKNQITGADPARRK